MDASTAFFRWFKKTGIAIAARMPMMRSLSRTEETSGLVTTIASSAKYIAICAPFSMPAGESQMMYSKPICLSSSMIRPTPSASRASLSRVCDAGRT